MVKKFDIEVKRLPYDGAYYEVLANTRRGAKFIREWMNDEPDRNPDGRNPS